MKKQSLRINRRIINDINNNVFAVYGFEEYNSKFLCWIEKFNFTDKESYESYINKYCKNEKLEKIGDWKSNPNL